MKMHTFISLFAVGIMLNTGAIAQQKSDHNDPLRAQGTVERMFPSELEWQTPLRAFPSDTFFPTDVFNERQIKELERAGISNVRQLIEADPRRLGRSLGIAPREVQAAQRKMRASLK